MSFIIDNPIACLAVVMCKEDLKAALSLTNRDKTAPLICWEDALQRSKTISLKEENNDIEVNTIQLWLRQCILLAK